MGGHSKYFLCTLWLLAIYAIGILIFTKGFLLTRMVVNQNSSCEEDFAGQAHNLARDQHGLHGCWMHARYKRAVFVIIDALRFDFVVRNNTPSDTELPYQNKLKTLHRLLENQPKNSRLYRFIADPPTTTMQRLKGLTTGSLPTFVDASANFASTKITEDNIIDQMKKQDKRIVFMGDDTWMGLFPDQFERAYPYPSLNVKDLHTVDNGVITHLIPEIKKRDWDVLIAHFLGVDHCGHRYGPDHPAMAEKLTQMDNVLRDLVQELDDETILFVFGDHGMTKTGDHGGDSWDELHAGLFVYSPSKITSSPKQQGKYQRLSQINLVPTVSLLLGLPIPFPNLGTVIEDLFNHCPWWDTSSNPVRQVFHTVKALHLNAHQVREYLIAYAKLSDELPYPELVRLDTLFQNSETELQNLVTAVHNEGHAPELQRRLEKLKTDYAAYLEGVKSMCEGIWAKFDMNCIILGLVITLTGAALNLLLVLSKQQSNRYCGIAVATWMTLLCIFLYAVKLKLKQMLISLFLGSISVTFISFLLWKVLTSQEAQVPRQKVEDMKRALTGVKEGNSSKSSEGVHHITLFSSLVLTLYCSSLFSNSFIVNESSVSAFFFQTTVFLLAYATLKNMSHRVKEKQQLSFFRKPKSRGSFDLGHLLTSPGTIMFSMALLTCLCIRISQNFRACREELLTCESPEFLRPLSALTGVSTQYKNMRYFISAAMVVVVPIVVRLWMKHYGNLNGFAPGVLWVRYTLPLSALCVCFHWALQALPSNIFESLPVWQIVIVPRLVYALSLLALGIILFKPLCIYLLPQNQEEDIPIVGKDKDSLIPKVYNHMKLNWRKHLKSTQHSASESVEASQQPDEKPPLVYGLATVFSSATLLLLSAVIMVMYMLLGDGMSLTLTTQVASMFLILEISACVSVTGDKADGHVPWPCILSWCLLASEHFFSTGHHTTITAIRWESAYNGFHGDFDNYVIPAFLIGINTFSSYILSTLGLPLLLFWPYTRGRLQFAYERDKLGTEMNKKGEFVLSEEPSRLQEPFFKLVINFVLFFGLKLFATMACAALHRRHLMVWKIFAPRFVYEAATFVVIASFCLLMYLFLIRIERAINKWIDNLSQTSS